MIGFILCWVKPREGADKTKGGCVMQDVYFIRAELPPELSESERREEAGRATQYWGHCFDGRVK